MIGEEFLWVERYRPKTVADCIMPERLKRLFQAQVDKGQIENQTLSGGPGIGKTTVARAMCAELDADCMVINASNDRNIDTLRNDVTTFASSISMLGGRKYVIFDEADYLNKESTQPALRNFIEEYSDNCGFILTCNFPNKLLEPILSRAGVVDLTLKKSEMQLLGGQFLKRACNILEQEGIEYERKVVAEVIMKHMPDWRRVLSHLQRYSNYGKIDEGILSTFSDTTFNELIEAMRNKKFSDVRKWVAVNSDIDPTILFRRFYDTCNDKFDAGSIPALILTIGKYQFQAGQVLDPEINLAAFFVEVMVDCTFK
jgi:DNA polymerase III delta prime subunit